MSFVNPYTFVPLGKRTPQYRRIEEGEGIRLPLEPTGVRGADESDSERRYTGAIHCTLTAKTPLCVPNTNDATDDVDLPFFRSNGKLAIPGSSLRGSIRSVYEALTDSCLRTNEERFHTTSAKKRPGLLMWSTMRKSFVLLDAERVRITDEAMASGLTVGQSVSFQSGKDPHNPHATRYVRSIGAGETGYFLRVHTMYSVSRGEERHNHPSLFVQEPAQHNAPAIDEQTIACFRENCDLYVQNSEEARDVAEKKLRKNEDDASAKQAYQRADEDLKAAEAYRSALVDFIEAKDSKKRLPVWFAREKRADGTNAYQLSFSQLSRSVYPQTPRSLAGERAQCCSIDQLCPACRLFGFVPQTNSGHALAGRVRFSDAIAIIPSGGKGVQTIRKTLATLLGPRQSSVEFYLRNPKSKHSYTPATPGTELAGRKAYWHHQGHGEWELVGEANPEFNKCAEIVQRGSRFAFDVYVDGVSREELNQLIYALSLGQWWGPDGTGRQYCHKIGHGKPIGLGSALIEVESVTLRAPDIKGGYALSNCVEKWRMDREDLEAGLTSVSAVKAVASFGAIPGSATISYPKVTREGDIFEWFAKNRDTQMRSQDDRIITYAQILPDVESTDQELSGSSEQQGQNHTGGHGERKPGTIRKSPEHQGQNRAGGHGERKHGTIKVLHKNGQSGHIARDDGEDDIFFYLDNVQGGKPVRDARVSFVIGRNKRGPCARDIRIE